MENNKKYDGEQALELMRKYRALTASEIRLINYLSEHKEFNGTYSDLVYEIEGKTTGLATLRNSIARLKSLGVVSVAFSLRTDLKHKPMKSCTIADDWITALLESDL